MEAVAYGPGQREERSLQEISRASHARSLQNRVTPGVAVATPLCIPDDGSGMASPVGFRDSGYVASRFGSVTAMFNVTIIAAFVVFVLSPCVSVLRPGAHRSEDQPFVL